MRKHAYNFVGVTEQIDYFAPHIKYFVFCNQYSDFTTLKLCTKLQNTEHYFGLSMYSLFLSRRTFAERKET